MNIAEQILEGYSSKDFKENYLFVLDERYHDQEGDIIRRIYDLFNSSNYETEQALSNYFAINKEQSKKVYDFIKDNFESFVKNFNGYWVGSTSLESYEFGEQEEQLTGMWKPGGGEYTLKYMQKVFDAAGYYVRGEYAYYNLQGGLHVDLLGDTDLLNNFLLTIK